MNLALFDFDGTITHVDTFTKFMLFAATKKRIACKVTLLLPDIIKYKRGVLATSIMRKKVYQAAFANTEEADIRKKGETYAHTIIPQFIIPKALERIHWHKEQGDTVVIVSASLDLYLQPWCEQMGLELLCSEVASFNGMLTGKYKSPDCCLEEKALRVHNKYNLADFEEVYAYGDTPEDKQLLELADKAFYQHF